MHVFVFCFFKKNSNTVPVLYEKVGGSKCFQIGCGEKIAIKLSLAYYLCYIKQ